jgi:hypothetical protein
MSDSHALQIQESTSRVIIEDDGTRGQQYLNPESG